MTMRYLYIYIYIYIEGAEEHKREAMGREPALKPET